MQIILGLILVAVGTGIIWKTESILRVFGRVTWAEEHLQLQGGSRAYYKIVGLILIFIGFLMITGLSEGFVMGIARKLFNL